MADADNRYNQGIKLGIKDTERLIKEFAQTMLEDLRNQSEASQVAMAEQIAAIESYFAPEAILAGWGGARGGYRRRNPSYDQRLSSVRK